MKPLNRLVVIAIAVVAIGIATVRADEPTPTAASTLDAAEVEKSRAKVQEELAQLRAAGASDAATDRSREIQLLESLDVLYMRIAQALQSRSDTAARRDEAHKQLRALPAEGLAEPTPYTITRVDGLRDELDSLTSRRKLREADLATAEEALEQAKQQLAEREAARRQAKETVELQGGAEAERDLELRTLENRVAAAEAQLRSLELQVVRQRKESLDLRHDFTRETLERMGDKVSFSRNELQDRLVAIQSDKNKLDQAIASARVELSAAEKLWARVKQREGTDGDASPEAEARRLGHQTRQIAVDLLIRQRQLLDEDEAALRKRFELANESLARDKMNDWHNHSRTLLDQINRDLRVYKGRLTEIEGFAERRAKDVGETTWGKEQVKQIRDRQQLYQTMVEHLEASRKLQRRLQAELDRRLAVVSIGERLREARAMMVVAWRYELTTIDDRPITVGKIVSALLIFVVGLGLAAFLSRQLNRRLFPRMGLAAGAAATVQSLLFYFFVAALTLISLRVVNVPLTAFTLLGGAVAIGVGFGSQNIVNNFFSGLILFIERPIRVGDIIQVDGTYGTVDSIGARSTVIRDLNNVEIVIPNSSFLEHNVINWTLSSDHAEFSLRVGVAYGSDTDQVVELLEQAVRDQPSVLKHPAPKVLLADFGDNAVVFELEFSVLPRLVDRDDVLSDVRFRIDKLFRAANVSFPFPQRDIHLDSPRPIDVRLIDASKDRR
ncbi:MAG TPA: mechanosensitive ion channel domain-containing protein [Terriglobales bacterium]|nr:mechanosensitive ion channel domain-containing protein [Terriglobales bacterium]